MDDCIVDLKNLGLSKCNKMPGYIRGMITTPIGFKATPVQAVDPAFWQAALLAGKADRIYLWPPFFGSSNASEATIYETTPLGKRRVRDGFYEFDITISENLCLHKAMYSHRATSGRVILFDTDNQLIGTFDSDGNFQGFSIQMLNTEKMMFNDGSVVSKSPVKLVLANNLEFDKEGSLLSAAFVNSLNRLTDVVITEVSGSATVIVVTVKAECDGTPISGLVNADFVLLDVDGDEQTIATAVEGSGSNLGTYTLTGTGLVTGTLGLVAPSELSIEAYEADAVAITVS